MCHFAEDMAEIEKGGDTMATLMGWLDDVDTGSLRDDLRAYLRSSGRFEVAQARRMVSSDELILRGIFLLYLCN